ncbi:ABC1 kinase family protein [Nosocomiicoccus massiliensis]|uniref:ABC1 kinase family protein n=1 Tax=Nosocomiicoccus massiliensis TaxID=1232430 RepID=UPI00041AEA8B|nr:AarF/ABC1/UbiB kinase family protein [Nosocomiicoccus massiliensis]
MIRNQFKYINRFREIAILFSKTGLGFIIEESGLDKLLSLPSRLFNKSQKQEEDKTIAERIRLFLEEAGPAYVKLGQIASTRGDILPESFIKELEKLQSNVPPFSSEIARELIEQELDIKIEDTFLIFEDEPLGSASIGQVHRAVLKTGEVVAIKVQRPNIERNIRIDLEILKTIAQVAEKNFKWAKQYQVTDIVDELSTAIIQEMDYTLEARNINRIERQFKNSEDVKFPHVYEMLSNKTILTMEYFEGISIRKVDELSQKGFDRYQLADTFARTIFTQIFEHGFFHADIHPGNIIVLNDGTLGFIDFGMVGKLTDNVKQNFGSLLIGLMQKNSKKVVRSIIQMGVVPDDVNVDDLYEEAELMQDKYYDIPLKDLEFGDAVRDLFTITNKYHIHLPKDFTLLAKTLITLEGNIEILYKDYSILSVAEPFGKKLLLQRLNPKRVAEDKFEDWILLTDIVEDSVTNIHQFTKGLSTRRLPISLELKEEKSIGRHLDRTINRISFSIVLMSLSILMAGIIVGSSLLGQGSILYKFPVIELGTILAIAMFSWLIFTIFKSGRM